MEEFDSIMGRLKVAANPDKAIQMKAYMRNQFEFYGISSPERREIFRPFFSSLDKSAHPSSGFVDMCYKQNEREFHYLAMEYVFYFRKRLTASSLPLIRMMITRHSWWDTVDYIASNILGYLVRRNPDLKNDQLEKWIVDDNMWLRRSALLFQLKYKSDTDTSLLENAIVNNLGSKEFFINKAIGWSLRQYSKFNPDWVRDFIKAHELSALSLREASRYI